MILHDSARGVYMTHNRKTFYERAIIYKNARDWMKKQRDKVIKRMNKRANDSQVKILAINASLGRVFSFLTEALLDQAYTIKTLSQKSQTSLNCSIESEILVDK